MKRFGIPLLVVAIAAVGTLYLVSQDRAVKVDDKGVPVSAPAPPTVAAGPPKAEVAGQAAIPPGAVIRSLDKINAAAKAVGCDELRPDDPAGKLIDVAECLGAKAQSAPGRTK